MDTVAYRMALLFTATNAVRDRYFMLAFSLARMLLIFYGSSLMVLADWFRAFPCKQPPVLAMAHLVAEALGHTGRSVLVDVWRTTRFFFTFQAWPGC